MRNWSCPKEKYPLFTRRWCFSTWFIGKLSCKTNSRLCFFFYVPGMFQVIWTGVRVSWVVFDSLLKFIKLATSPHLTCHFFTTLLILRTCSRLRPRELRIFLLACPDRKHVFGWLMHSIWYKFCMRIPFITHFMVSFISSASFVGASIHFLRNLM